MLRISLLSLILVSTLITELAFASDAPSAADIKRAATAYDQGRERFREEQYTEAAEKFEAADGYAPSAAALRLAIFARKEAGQLDRALTHAALALELYPDNPEIASEAQGVIDESAAEFARVSVSCDEPCDLLLSNRIVHGQASTSRTIYVTPGTAEIRASWSEGRSASETVALDAGSEEELSFYSPEIPTAPDPSSDTGQFSTSSSDGSFDGEEKGGWHPAVFWTGLTLTVVGASATTALGIRAQNNPGRQAVLDNCEKGQTSCEEYKEGVRNQGHANIALGATAAFGVFTVVSAIMTDWGKKKDESVSREGGDLSIRPTFAVGNGASLGAVGTF